MRNAQFRLVTSWLTPALTCPLKVKHGRAVSAVNGDGQPDGRAVVHHVLGLHRAHLREALRAHHA